MHKAIAWMTTSERKKMRSEYRKKKMKKKKRKKRKWQRWSTVRNRFLRFTFVFLGIFCFVIMLHLDGVVCSWVFESEQINKQQIEINGFSHNTIVSTKVELKWIYQWQKHLIIPFKKFKTFRNCIFDDSLWILCPTKKKVQQKLQKIQQKLHKV